MDNLTNIFTVICIMIFISILLLVSAGASLDLGLLSPDAEWQIAEFEGGVSVEYIPNEKILIMNNSLIYTDSINQIEIMRFNIAGMDGKEVIVRVHTDSSYVDIEMTSEDAAHDILFFLAKEAGI